MCGSLLLSSHEWSILKFGNLMQWNSVRDSRQRTAACVTPICLGSRGPNWGLLNQLRYDLRSRADPRRHHFCMILHNGQRPHSPLWCSLPVAAVVVVAVIVVMMVAAGIGYKARFSFGKGARRSVESLNAGIELDACITESTSAPIAQCHRESEHPPSPPAEILQAHRGRFRLYPRSAP